MAVQSLYTEDELVHILWVKKLKGMSLRKIAEEYAGLSHADIQRCLKGIFPKSHLKRLVLGLSSTSNVVAIHGDIPEGAQAPPAYLCPCGRWFISNHPRRRKCFICSPYRKRT